MVCTHLHDDHASGLIELVKNKAFTFQHAWMHDIRNHMSPDALRRASASDGVAEVVETTKELRAGFASRGLTPSEPFTGTCIAGWPEMSVIGPSTSFYRKAIQKFTDVSVHLSLPLPSLRTPLTTGLAALAGSSPTPELYRTLAGMLPPPQVSSLPFPSLPLTGALSQSSVQENPSTQPYNNTSTILGVNIEGTKLLFTGDAGSEALAAVGPEWNHLTMLCVPHHASDGNLSRSDIERFAPRFAVISAKGGSSHPSRSIVSGLVKIGAKVGSTHEHGNLRFYAGTVPYRPNYVRLNT